MGIPFSAVPGTNGTVRALGGGAQRGVTRVRGATVRIRFSMDDSQLFADTGGPSRCGSTYRSAKFSERCTALKRRAETSLILDPLPTKRLFCYLHQSIMPPVIILPPPKTRTSNKTTTTVPMMISTVLVLVVVLLM
jgi:hypothetical protein